MKGDFTLKNFNSNFALNFVSRTGNVVKRILLKICDFCLFYGLYISQFIEFWKGWAV